MRIVCPSCATTYEVPPTALGQGRTVQCARCSETWTPLLNNAAAGPGATRMVLAQPPLPASNPARPPGPLAAGGTASTRFADGPLDRLAPPSSLPRRGGAIVWIGWLATVLLVASIGWTAVAWRTDIVRLWPPSERLYLALGLDR